MKNYRSIAISTFLLYGLILQPAPVWAKENPGTASPGDSKLRPVEVHYSTLGGLQYSVDGRLLMSYEDFRDLLMPLRDYESERLLKRSETSDVDSKIFEFTGFAGLVTGIVGLLTSPASQQTPFWVSAIGGGGLIDVGSLFQSEAQTAKFNCVQRYNRFARGEEQVLPQGPANEKSLLNFDSGENPGSPQEKPPPNK